MAKATVYLDGLDSVINDLNRMEIDIEETARDALDVELKDIAIKMEANRASMLPNSTRIKEGIGTDIGSGDGFISGSVGVFDIKAHQAQRATAAEERTAGGKHAQRQVTAVMLALWAESGIRPHSTSSGSKLAHEQSGTKGREAKSSGGIHGGVSPKPFMSQAFDASAVDMFKNIEKKLTAKLKAK